MGTLFCADAHKRKRQDPNPGALHPNLRLFTKQKPRCGYLTSDAWLAAEPPFYLHCFPGDVWEGETYTGNVYEEFHVDKDALYRLILDVFYEEVE